MPDLSVIIVSYNTCNYLKAAIESIYKSSSEVNFEIIVVDNVSTDGSLEMLAHNFPSVIILRNKENLGFAKANNLGVAKAKGKFILFLNPDTVVYPKVLEYVLDFMRTHPKCGASTCRLEMQSGKLDYASHRGFPTPWNSLCYFLGLTQIFPKSRLFSGYTQGWKNMQEMHEIDALAGAFMFVRREAGDEVKWWDEDYFFNGEDLDFCYKLRQKKWQIYYLPKYAILHYNGVSGGTKQHTQDITTADKERKIFVTRHRFEAMKIFYNKHYHHKYPKFIRDLVMWGIDYKLKKTLRSLDD